MKSYHQREDLLAALGLNGAPLRLQRQSRTRASGVTCVPELGPLTIRAIHHARAARPRSTDRVASQATLVHTEGESNTSAARRRLDGATQADPGTRRPARPRRRRLPAPEPVEPLRFGHRQGGGHLDRGHRRAPLHGFPWQQRPPHRLRPSPLEGTRSRRSSTTSASRRAASPASRPSNWPRRSAASRRAISTRCCSPPAARTPIEVALKLARAATGRFKTLSFWDAFHGAGFGAVSVGGEATFRSGIAGPLLPGTEHVAPWSALHCPYGHDSLEASGLACANMISFVLGREGDFAAFVAEPMRATPQPPPPGFWKAVREACDRHGTLLIFDEIPTGLGKTGKFFASEHDGVTPDIIVLGKSLGGGILPIASVIARHDLDVAGDYAIGHYTHEKNPVTARAALTTIAIIREEGLAERAAELGRHAMDRMRDLMARSPFVGDVRGRGLLFGVELVEDKATRHGPQRAGRDASITAACKSGLSFKISQGNVLTLSPPLVIARTRSRPGARHRRRAPCWRPDPIGELRSRIDTPQSGDRCMKAVRTDRELECPGIDAGLRARGVELVTLAGRHRGGRSGRGGRRRRPAADVLHAGHRAGDRGGAAAEGHRQIRRRHRRHRHPGRHAARHSRRQRARLRRGNRRRRRVRADDRARQAAAGDHARASRRDGWVWPAQRWLGRDYRGATLGLVGCGRIGRSMARMAGQGFRARVLGFDPHVDAPTMRASGIEKVDDLHAHAPRLRLRVDPLRPERGDARPDRAGRTRLPEDRRRSSINVSRGALIDETALVGGDRCRPARRGRPRRLFGRAADQVRPSAQCPVRARRRHPVSASDLLHRRSHAAAGRGHAGALLRNSRRARRHDPVARSAASRAIRGRHFRVTLRSAGAPRRPGAACHQT